MQWLASLCVRRPIFASVLTLLIVVVGFAAYSKLGIDRFPNIDIPIVTITTILPGASPEDVETEITDKVESAVNTISGIDELRSISAEGISQVFVTFKLEKNLDVASQEVRDHLNLVIPQLPQGIDLPTVMAFDPSAIPVLVVSLSSEKPTTEVTELADKRVRRQLEGIPGVGQVNLIGGRARQVNVILDPVLLRGARVTAADVQRTIQLQNLTMPGGRVEAGPRQLTLRVRGRVEEVAALGDLIVREDANHPIRIHDVGTVVDGMEEEESTALRNGTPTVLLSIVKQSGQNTIAVVDAVRERLETIQATLPAGYKLEAVRDDSGVIRTSVDAVKEHLVLGAILAALVVLLFLGNVRSTIIAALAIPTSIIGTFTLMWLQGFTLNVITLLALALVVGIVIDDAIVVLENIFRHVEEKGEDPRSAAVTATKEIGLAVLATTLSLIVIFLPIAFLAGIPGRFLRSFGLTMACSIGVSLIVSFTLTPMLSARWLKLKEKRTVLDRVVDRVYQPMERLYMRALAFVMRRRWVVVVASIVAVVSCVPLVSAVPKGFLPRNEEAQIAVTVRGPEGMSLAQTTLETERIAREIRKLPWVLHTLTTVGDDQGHTANLGGIYVRLSDPRDRDESQEDVMAVIRKDILPKAPKDLRVTVGEVNVFGQGGFSTATIQYVISGPDLGTLEGYARRILEKLKQVRGAVDVDSTMVAGRPELGVYIDRSRASDLGVQVADIAATLRLLVGGVNVSSYEEHGEQYDVNLRADPRFRADPAGMRILTVPSTRLGSVPLDAVVTLKEGTSPSVINRLNRRRQVTLLANFGTGASQSEISTALKKIIDDERMPAEYLSTPFGQTREMARVFSSFLLSLVLAFVFMYLVLAAQFESWLHPITILLSLPLTLPFAFISLLLLGQQLDIFSALGILVLFGVVKKNSILQIDHTNQLRERGMERLEAILQANKDRLRPILMTTFAFVAGMIPLSISRGIGAGFNRATAGVVVAGQILSLLLTLLATPVAYSLFDDASQWFRRRFKLGGPAGEAPAPVVPHE